MQFAALGRILLREICDQPSALHQEDDKLHLRDGVPAPRLIQVFVSVRCTTSGGCQLCDGERDTYVGDLHVLYLLRHGTTSWLLSYIDFYVSPRQLMRSATRLQKIQKDGKTP